MRVMGVEGWGGVSNYIFETHLIYKFSAHVDIMYVHVLE